MASNAEVYEKVTQRIMAILETGSIEQWSKPWKATGVPVNAISRRPYNGGNAFALWFAGLSFESAGWVTFNQARKAGVIPDKGSKGEPVYFMKKWATKDKTSGEDKSIFLARLFYVFNLDQLKDLPGHEGALAKLKARVTERVHDFQPDERAEQIVKDSKAVIRHGSARACYSPLEDRISMPRPSDFKTTPLYYSTLFHEMGHWTGHKDRLNRDLAGRFGNESYALEELVAELCAAFLSTRLGWDHTSQAAPYLASWLKAAKADPSALVGAASAASKAADYLFPSAAFEEADDEEAAEPVPLVTTRRKGGKVARRAPARAR